MFDRYIAFQAQLQPRASAIATVAGDISFAQFEDELAAVAFWAQEAHLQRDRVVAVRIADRYLHWLVRLALARLGVPAASVVGTASPSDVERYGPQLLVTDRDDATAARSATCPVAEMSVPVARRLIQSSNRLRSGAPVVEAALAGVAASSGTTGEPKLIGFSWRQINTRFPNFLRASPKSMSRILPLVGPEMGGFEASLCAWSSGGTVVFGPSNLGELADALPQLAPASLAGAPVQLQLLLNALPEGSLPHPAMRVSLFGAHTPGELKRELSERLSSDIHTLYGSTEAGLMAWASTARLSSATAVGYVPPWVDLEIVDENDRSSKAGVEGVVRVRGPGVATSYLNDPDASAAHFRDGWFYPGDLGLLTPGGLLHLNGRSNEVINLGGEKVLPIVLEEAMRADPAVIDAAAFMAASKEGVEAPWVALVTKGSLDKAKLSDRLMRSGGANVSLLFVTEIPRNARGKVLREPLRVAVLAQTP